MAKPRIRDLVVMLPGITGSVLQKDGKDVWALSGQAAWTGLRKLGKSLDQLTLADDDPNVEDLGDSICWLGPRRDFLSKCRRLPYLSECRSLLCPSKCQRSLLCLLQGHPIGLTESCFALWHSFSHFNVANRLPSAG